MAKKTKKAVKKVAKTPARPASARASRTQATASALNTQHATAVDERARARSANGERWAARNKPH